MEKRTSIILLLCVFSVSINALDKQDFSCLQDSTIEFTVDQATSEGYVVMAAQLAIDEDNQAVPDACQTNITDDTSEFKLRIKFGDCSTTAFNAGQANTDLKMQIVVYKNADFVHNTDNTILEATCQYDAAGNPVATSVGTFTSNKITKTPSDANNQLAAGAIKTRVVKASDGTPVTECTIDGTSTELYTIESEVATSINVKGLFMVTISINRVDGTKKVMMTDKCSVPNNGIIAMNKGSKPVASAPLGLYYARLSGSFQCIRLPGKKDITINVMVGVCTGPDTLCDVKGCVNDARRKRDVNNNYEMHNTTVIWNVKDPKGEMMTPCVGYTSNMVFYVVVSVLTVLLVMTIGVAAYLGTRVRATVMSGKDNPVYMS